MSLSDEHLPEEGGAVGGPGSEQLPEQAPSDDAPGADEGAPEANGSHLTELAEEADPREVLARERDEYLLALQRTQADFENYRKRVVRLQEEQSARASVSWWRSSSRSSTPSTWPKRIRTSRSRPAKTARLCAAARAMLVDVLAKEGLDRVDQAGVPFDPTVHDAVAHSQAEGDPADETTVEEVLRSGYRWKGQVLRAAMVRVKG